MARFWVIAVLTLGMSVGVAPGGGKDKDKEEFILKADGKLTKDDPKDPVRNGASKVHVVKLKRGFVYTIDMVTPQFDAYLRLEDSKGSQLDQDDDSGGGLNARIIFNCQRDDDYKIIATCFSDAAGDYVLTVKQGSLSAKPGIGRTLLVGKPAPDFQGDFAVNGKPGKLSDLKGQVVLLDLCSVRSATSVASWRRLNQWHKAHETQGLAVVSATFYQFEFGQKLGFDAESGRLKDLDKADKGTETAMLKAFAAHHKLEHRLMVLPKDEALRTFDTLAVNGLPQAVLIDRQGVIRMVQVGHYDQFAVSLEEEMRKLLAEK